MARSLAERLSALTQTHRDRKQDTLSSTPKTDPPVRECDLSAGTGDGSVVRQAVRVNSVVGANVVNQKPYTDASDDAALKSLGFACHTSAQGAFWLRELRYDVLTRHGNAFYAQLLSSDFTAIQHLAQCPVSAKQLRFYDTETTGLGTGAGTFAFLHAVGQFEGDEFCIYQYLIQDYAEEMAVLHELCRSHFHDAILVTFNGKSFDWPLFQNRCILHHISPPVLRGHVDLLHPSRRLWRLRLPRVSLGMVEEHQLGLVRTGDVPGKEAPARYFAFINDRDADFLAPVLDHNAMDVASLATLLHHIEAVLSADVVLETAAEYAALGRWYHEWADDDTAARCYVQASNALDADWRIHWQHSLFLKRRKSYGAASNLWEQMLEDYPWTVQPAVELAKYAEHRLADYVLAEQYVRIALRRTVNGANGGQSTLQMPHRVGVPLTPPPPRTPIEAHFRAQLEHRLVRVQTKRARDAER